MSETDTSRSTLRITLYVLTLICVFMILFQEYWRDWRVDDPVHNHPFRYDKAHYYSYLPSLILHGNLDFDFEGAPGMTAAPNGGLVPKTTYGMSLMYFPWFMLGHKIAINENSPLTGFSEPYAKCVHYGTFFYTLMGFLMLAFVLRRFFSDIIVAVTIGVLFFATNIFFYSMREGEMAHVYCFFLISAFMLLTCRWHEQRKNRTLLMMGFVAGLLTLIRPTEILIVIFFLLYRVNSWRDLVEKVKELFLKRYLGLLLFVLAAFIMWVPQMLFWKYKTDNFLFFSYNSEESFFWLDPQIINVLFSYRKGWFVYTPVLFLAVIGLFFMKGELKMVRWSVLVYLVLNIYVISCWWCWWYGGGFGMRALVQSYAIVAIPLAAFFARVAAFDYQKFFVAPVTKLIVVAWVSICLSLNIIQTYQCSIGMLHWDAMTKESYWYIFDKFYYVFEDIPTIQKYSKPPDYGAAIKGERD